MNICVRSSTGRREIGDVDVDADADADADACGVGVGVGGGKEELDGVAIAMTGEGGGCESGCWACNDGR